MAREIEEMFNIKGVSVIRNGIDLDRFRNVDKTKKEKRRELGIDEDAWVIGQVGRFDYQKNPEFTVALFSQISCSNPKARLMLVGRGKQEKQLREQIRNLGLEGKAELYISRNDIPELLKAMDVFILPSRFEGFGIVLVEAQAAGLPCVVSDQVPSEVYLSENITKLSLDEPISVWASSLMNPLGNIDSYGDIEDYDMKKEIRNLEKLYLA